jgi:hypothetical protein
MIGQMVAEGELQTLRMSPAMAAGVAKRLWSPEDVITKIDEMAPAPKPSGPDKKRRGEN